MALLQGGRVSLLRSLAPGVAGMAKGEEYTDQGQACYEERYRERVLRQLSQRANKLGMQLVVAPQAA